MVIVSVTRGGLRDEFDMADEAFALSPISARATLPSEEDYDAISQAFMETSRGRWFLGEYAKRNRNADTRMVLDAVARIEDQLAAEKEAIAKSRLSEALAAIRQAVEEAETAAAAAAENLAPEESLAPIRKGTRIIREISWRWREIGADSRICDLIDSQADAIEGACGQISLNGPRATLNAAFDLIKARIARLEDSEPQGDDAVLRPSFNTASSASPAKAADAAQGTAAASGAEFIISMPAEEPGEAIEVAGLTAEAADVDVDALDALPEIAQQSVDAVDDYDDALLDIVALEMAAPDPVDIDDAPAATADDIRPAEPTPAAPVMLAQKPEPVATPAEPPAVQASHQAPLPSSLGSTLLANGIVKRPRPTASDPLAPIRRMSQAEKIAFFS
jgi:hypothetical protein